MKWKLVLKLVGYTIIAITADVLCRIFRVMRLKRAAYSMETIALGYSVKAFGVLWELIFG